MVTLSSSADRRTSAASPRTQRRRLTQSLDGLSHWREFVPNWWRSPIHNCSLAARPRPVACLSAFAARRISARPFRDKPPARPDIPPQDLQACSAAAGVMDAALSRFVEHAICAIGENRSAWRISKILIMPDVLPGCVNDIAASPRNHELLSTYSHCTVNNRTIAEVLSS